MSSEIAKCFICGREDESRNFLYLDGIPLCPYCQGYDE